MHRFALTKEELKELSIWPATPKRYTDHAELAYSQGYWLKKFLFYPHFFDLYVTLQHGVYHFKLEYGLDKIDVLQDTNIFFSYNKNLNTKYKKNYTIGSPFIWYKEKYNIKKEDGKYTLVFPIHTAADEKKIQIEELEKCIENLNNLSRKYEPFLICLYFRDIELADFFIKKGFSVTTIGHGSRYDFIPRFYNILKYAKYTVSNRLGSYAFYSIDLGIPFRIFDSHRSNAYDFNREIFKKDSITKEQKEMIYKYLGKSEERENKFKLSLILYKEFFKFKFRDFKRWSFKNYLLYYYEPKKRLYLGILENYEKKYIEYLYEKYNDITFKNNLKKAYLIYFEFIHEDEKNDLIKAFNLLKINGVLVVKNKSNYPIQTIFIDNFENFKYKLGFKNFYIIQKER